MSSGDQRYPFGADHEGLLSITWAYYPALKIYQALCKQGKAGALKTIVLGNIAALLWWRILAGLLTEAP